MAFRAGELRVDDPEAGPLRVSGDGYAAAGELVTLVVSPDVQRFLGMTDDEVAEVSEIDRRYRRTLRDVYAAGAWRPPHVDPAARPAQQEVERAVEGLLGTERTERLRRVSRRIRGGDALLDPDVADAVRLTVRQRERLAQAAEENEREYTRVLSGTGAVRTRGADRLGDPSVLREQAARAHAAGSSRLQELLTAEQRERLADLGAVRTEPDSRTDPGAPRPA
jgi:hypothetical protein